MKRFSLVLLVCMLVFGTLLNGVVFAAGEVKLTAASATASTSDPNCSCDASKAIDGSLTTRWSGEGVGASLKLDLGSSKTVAFAKMAFYNGSSRAFTFDIQTSTDDITYTTRVSGATSALNNNLQTFDFTDVSARYVRIIGAGNSTNNWNSYTEVEAWGFAAGGGDTTAPTAPTNLTATAASTSQINLSWTASTDSVGVTGYDVFRGTTFVKTVTTTSTSDTDLTASTTYSYTVKAKDAAGNVSAASNTASATTQAGTATDAKFSIPGTSVTASTSDANVPANTVDGSLTTRWSGQGDGAWIQFDLGSNKKVAFVKIAFYNGSTRTSTFDIHTSTDGTIFNPVQSNLTSAPNNNLQTFDFTDVDPARYVRIVGHGNSSSNWNSYTEVEVWGMASSGGSGGGDTTAPTTPAGLTASAASSSQINLSWTASTDNVSVTGYDVYRGGTFLKSVTGTTTSDTGLTASTTYSYTVKAKDAAGNVSAASNTASATTSTAVTVPAAPTNLIAAAGDGQASLSWTASSGAASYNVKRSTTSGSGYTSVATGITSTSYTNIGLTNGTTYYYVVTAVNSAGESSNSNQASAAPQASTSSYDAGLNMTFQYPSPVTGSTINVLNYGATANNPADDDFTAFQNAINAANAGDEVYVPNGTYHFKTRKIQLKAGVSLRGQDKNNAILSSNFDTVDGNTGSYIIGAAPGVSNLTISDLKFNMYGGQSLRYPIWLGAEPSTSDVHRIEVKNTIVEGFEKMAISVRNGHHVYIHDNLIKDASALGGGGEGYGVMIGYPNSHNNLVSNNYIGPNIRHAVLIQYSAHHNLVEYNTADSTTEDSYDLHGEDEYSNELRYNIAFGSLASGFGVGNTGSTHYDAGPKNWIHHNEVWNSEQGINIINESHGQYIEDNYFHHNSDIGIKVYSGGGNNLVFKRNTVQYNQAGTRFEDGTGLVFDSNIVTNNTTYSLKTTSVVTGYTITNNDFRFNGAPYELGSTSGTVSNNQQ